MALIITCRLQGHGGTTTYTHKQIINRMGKECENNAIMGNIATAFTTQTHIL